MSVPISGAERSSVVAETLRPRRSKEATRNRRGCRRSSQAGSGHQPAARSSSSRSSAGRLRPSARSRSAARGTPARRPEYRCCLRLSSVPPVASANRLRTVWALANSSAASIPPPASLACFASAAPNPGSPARFGARAARSANSIEISSPASISQRARRRESSGVLDPRAWTVSASRNRASRARNEGSPTRITSP
jgi:hypothetical protein